MKILRHILAVSAALFLTLGVPTLCYVDVPALLSGNVDVMTHASTYLPDAPSGEFYVLMNESTQRGFTDQWVEFFTEGDVEVIMSDISCMVVQGDIAAQQLAERFRARLPENQMTITRENGLLLASRVEDGIFDAVVISSEMLQIYKMQDLTTADGVVCIMITQEAAATAEGTAETAETAEREV